MESDSSINRIGFIGNYLPRQCGIATFTTDLCEAIATEYSDTSCIALPVNDVEAGYAYPPRVRFELVEKDIDSYRRAADFLNINGVDPVCLQHEYGIFGGPAGGHSLALLRELRMPLVTTLHTILQDPTPIQRRVLQEVAALSDWIIVVSERGVDFLQEVYGVPPEKIDFIPHGIPDVSFVDPSFHKDLFGVEGKMVLLSFGLLSTNKGLETVIAALPSIVARHPNVVYLIVGATHPHVLRQEGETYRLSLQRLAQDLGVAERIIFYNRFVNLEELIEFISAADIYITPYLNPAQITSGTLAYTLGAGKAVISTLYWYAEEMLAGERGTLVPFRDPVAVAEQVIDLLDNESKRHAMRKRAYLFGRAMLWPQVAQRYMESFERAWAFTLIGIHEYLRRFDGDSRASHVRDELAGRLLALYQDNRSDAWRWYEAELSYCNALLPQAMLMCGQWIPDRAMSEAGLESLRWLADLQRADEAGGHFVPIGSNGFYERDGQRARFDQQPVEAQTMASACLEAYRGTGDERWLKEAQCAFEWFLGRNDLNLPLYDPTTGGCRDGLHPDRPNENQGAESTLAFLQTLLELRPAEHLLLTTETQAS